MPYLAVKAFMTVPYLAQSDGSVMTFSVPSFLAALARAYMPAAALSDPAVDTFLLLVLLPPPPPEEPLRLHPAAKMRLPAAAVATTAYRARKIPSQARCAGRKPPECGSNRPHHG